ncbi:alpha-ketoglutarate-dependent dioxygenase AlkB [Asticcacaulis sp. AC460]|uniref:alpha-ketoglutarate-dependent dioxygenase AlkB n=1 Tax=Asticcacaulis sp. AC460 TaxID=1282360 RepID=UPI0004022195|nr:alpha-ketoglutarate-dependent dioxygenase AlkB [Asticcacaulis sp. AC460]
MSAQKTNLSLFDLFEPEPVPGLSYREDYITPAEEAELIAQIDRRPWSLELLRRRQWYGWAYDDTALGRPSDYQPQPMEEWLNIHARRLHGDGWFAGVPQCALVNEYEPGQGIGAHKDRDIEHIRSVAILSLGSAAMMDFTRPNHVMRSHYLRPRSLVVMTGEVREHWMHGIVGRKSDRLGGLVLPRGRRLSLTMRYAAGE